MGGPAAPGPLDQDGFDPLRDWPRPYSPGPLTEQEVKAFWEDGFVIKHGVLQPQDLQPVLGAIEA